MGAIKSAAELKSLYRRLSAEAAEKTAKIQIKVHLGTCGISSGANQTLQTFLQSVESGGLKDVLVTRASCIGLCSEEPCVTVEHPRLGRTIYRNLIAERVQKIVDLHILRGQIVDEWAVDTRSPRFQLQEIRILRNQDIDPLRIEEYIARGGYLALAKVLTEMGPEGALAEIKKAGLRGRGGAGFPTATKWGFVRQAGGNEKYVVCNGDEGDPGAYMNRAVLEGNPHSLIEGMAIGAWCIGNVKQGFAYVRAEYPLAIETLNEAIRQAREMGLLGENILGTDFDFDLEIFPGAGAFVCGEETALLASIEGNRGTPRQRPPFPANQGLFGKPTTLNNVETYANVPLIIAEGADWFAGTGSRTAKGTKTLCLVGKVKDTGLVEAPLGTSLGDIIYGLGGGIQDDKKFKAAQLGGPSGGVIPAAHLNTPVDYDSIPPLGAIMGSGGIVVMDEDSCMVDVAKYFLEFTKDESCGKCISCRDGNPKMYDILCKISAGKANVGDLKTLEELADLVKSASICGLGQTAPNPVLTTLKYFRDEYEAHILDKRCPAAVCQALFKAPCQHTCPAGLNVPAYIGLIKEGKYQEAYQVMRQKLPFPMVLGRVCPAHCQDKCRRGQIDEAVAIRHLKRFAADYAFEHDLPFYPQIAERKTERIAVVGAGPAGLSAAYELAVKGYPVTVFEELSVAGGMLAVGIPEYRLPRKVLKKEIADVLNLGVELKLNSRVDDVPSLLKQGYGAVLIAVGAHKGNRLGITGEELKGVVDAVDFLRAVNLGREIEIGRKVAVVGGGNSAIDAARVSIRKGAAEVHLIYRRSKADMPAEPEEIAAAEAEGVRLHVLSNPQRVLELNGRVAGLECVKMAQGKFDQSGRRSVSPLNGSEEILDIDRLIAAAGQGPDTQRLNLDGVQRDRGGRILADPRTLMASDKGIFVSGDAFSGPATVIEAVASGQRAAASIDRFLRGDGGRAPQDHNGHSMVSSALKAGPEMEIRETRRTPIAEIPLDARRPFQETVLSYTPDEAGAESDRCLRCDLETAN